MYVPWIYAPSYIRLSSYFDPGYWPSRPGGSYCFGRVLRVVLATTDQHDHKEPTKNIKNDPAICNQLVNPSMALADSLVERRIIQR